jgi:hypothetical protein
MYIVKLFVLNYIPPKCRSTGESLALWLAGGGVDVRSALFGTAET